MYLDTKNSSIPLCASVEDFVDNIPGLNGEFLVSNKLQAINFNLILRSMPGLNNIEKEEIKFKINKFLAEAKEYYQTLYFQKTKKAYQVKYVGTALKTQEYLSWIEFNIPLKAYDPIGYSLNEKIASDIGIYKNNGNVEVSSRIEFIGPLINPFIIINGEKYLYNNSIEEGYMVIVNAKNLTVIKKNINTNEVYNVEKYWNDNFFYVFPGPFKIDNIIENKEQIFLFWKDGYL